MYTFDIKISPVENVAIVLQNNKPVNNQSQLWRCGVEPFLDWVRELPNMLFAEFNNYYDLIFTGSELECQIITGIFSHDQYCNSVSCTITDGRYNLEQRVDWANMAATELKTTLPTMRNIGVTASDSCSFLLKESLKKYHGIKNKLFSIGGIDVYITDSAKEVDSVSQKYEFVYLCTDGRMRFDNSETKCMFFQGRREDVGDFLSQLSELIVLKPFLTDSYSKLSSLCANAAFLTKAKVEMLRNDVPCARLIFPSQQTGTGNGDYYRIEVGDKVSFRIEKFPDEKLKLNIREPNILQLTSGNEFLAVGIGKANINISFCNRIIWNGVIETYHVNRVTAIQMNAPTGTILENSTFQIQYTFYPQNAQNKANSVWTVTPSGNLKILGDGKFEAIKAGTATITLSVDNVKESIQIPVIIRAKSIHAPREVIVKVNHGGKPVSISTLPSGSGYSSMVVRSLDQNIAIWDSSCKEVRAISEGDTILEIRALDENNHDLATKQIPIYVLPEKNIITLPYIPTVIAALVLISFLCIKTWLVYVSTGIAITMCIMWLYRKLKYGIHQFTTRFLKYEIPVVLLYIIASLSALAYHLYDTYYYWW